MLSHARRVGGYHPWVGPTNKALPHERVILNNYFK